MSKETAQDFASAALRHVRDARFLLDGCGGYNSPDQAWHLAGFGPECIRKACLASREWDKVLGHNLKNAGDEVLRFLIDMEPGVTRYRISDWSAQEQVLTKWSEGARYNKTGWASAVEALPLVEAAERCVRRVAYELWMDGVLADIEG